MIYITVREFWTYISRLPVPKINSQPGLPNVPRISYIVDRKLSGIRTTILNGIERQHRNTTVNKDTSMKQALLDDTVMNESIDGRPFYGEHNDDWHSDEQHMNNNISTNEPCESKLTYDQLFEPGWSAWLNITDHTASWWQTKRTVVEIRAGINGVICFLCVNVSELIFSDHQLMQKHVIR